MLHTTFRKAKEAGACSDRYKKMARALGGVRKYGIDTPIPLDKVLEVCGLEDTLWALRITIEPAEKEIRLFACDCAERVLPLFEKEYPDDKRSRLVIETSRRFANGKATQEELTAARAAARDASRTAWAAEAAAAWAALAAAGGAAADAAGGAAADAAGREAEREWQTQHLLGMLRG